MASKKAKTGFVGPTLTPPPRGAEYVNIADGVEGFAFYDPDTNELVTLEGDQPGTAQSHLRRATKAEIEGARRGFAAESASQKARGLAESAVSGATFGLLTNDTPEAKARAAVLGQQNPLLKGAATVAGTLVPAALGGGLVGAGGRALGLGRAAMGVATAGAEELAQSASFEMAQAAEEDRKIEVGNIAQGLLEGAAFLGAGRFAGKLLRRTADQVEDIAGGPAQALARAQKQAATASDVEKVVPSRAEAIHYSDNVEQIHQETSDLAYEAGNKLFGRDGSFSRAHNISFKKQDVWGKMADADLDAVGDGAEAFADQLDELAVKLSDNTHTSAPSPAAARSLRAQAENLRKASTLDVEDAAVAHDQAKRHLDDLRSKFGGHATKGTDPLRSNVNMIDEVLEPMRKDLEDETKWGKIWASKQAAENRLWSGNDGIINSRARWQSKLMQREPGAAGTYRSEWGDLPAFKMKGDDLVHSVLSLGRKDREEIIKALDLDVKQSLEMSDIKATIGGPDTRKAVGEVMADLEAFRDAVNEIKRIDRVQKKWGALLKQRTGRKSITEDALDAAPLAGAIGGGPLGAVAGIAARGLKKTLLDAFTPAAKESAALTLDEMRRNIAKRNVMRAGGGTLKGRAAVDAVSPSRAALEGKITDFYGKPVPDQSAMSEAADLAETVAAGKSIEDMHALPLEPEDGGVARLRSYDHFKQTGNVEDNLGKSAGGLPQITVEDGKPYMSNGRHRWTAAQEEGMEYVVARIRKIGGDGEEAWAYIGPVRVSGKPAGPAAGRAAVAGTPDEAVGGFKSSGKIGSRLGDISRAAASSVGPAAAETIQEVGGGTLAALGVVGIAAETAAVRELDQHSRDTAERAMLDLGAPDGDGLTPGTAPERFQGSHRTLGDAYSAHMADMNRLLDDPEEFVARTTAAFQPLAEAGHPELASQLITRMAVGMRYLRENAPPTLGQSIFSPEGEQPDEIAVLQFAPVWEAVWRPTDTVRDIGTRSATPSAVKALRDVHPDVYQRALGEVFKTLAISGPTVDFETKRYLDNVFQLGGAVGRSFSPDAAKILATTRQDNKPTSRSLGGENNVAPNSANEMFSNGPTSLR